MWLMLVQSSYVKNKNCPLLNSKVLSKQIQMGRKSSSQGIESKIRWMVPMFYIFTTYKRRFHWYEIVVPVH